MALLVMLHTPYEDDRELEWKIQPLCVLCGAHIDQRKTEIEARFAQRLAVLKARENLDLMVEEFSTKTPHTVIARLIGPKPSYDQALRGDAFYETLHRARIATYKQRWEAWKQAHAEDWQGEIAQYRRSLLGTDASDEMMEQAESCAVRTSYYRPAEMHYPHLEFQSVPQYY